MPAKKSKKHAKDRSAVAVAVTQDVPEISSSGSDDNSHKSNKIYQAAMSSEHSPAASTPETLATAPLPVNVNYTIPSPLLDGLSNTSVSASTAYSLNNEWTGAAMAGSPGNLISLTGESPPTQPSSYEESSRVPRHWAASRPFTPASPSPPNSRRPLSYHLESHQQTLGVPRPPSQVSHRRDSIHSPKAHLRAGSQTSAFPQRASIPFHTLADVDTTPVSQASMKAGEKGYFSAFDRLPSHQRSFARVDHVFLAGYEGGLEVYSVGHKGLDRVASLKGLRGGVYGAKILPWIPRQDLDNVFPLVAIVLHGPVLTSNGPTTLNPSATASPKADGATSPRSAFSGVDGNYRTQLLAEAFRTVVQIYSLKTNQLVDTILESPPISIDPSIPIGSAVFRPPPPLGAFSVAADAGNIVVSSGVSGECWVYSQLPEKQNAHLFACVAKLWTSLQPKSKGEASHDSDQTDATGSWRRHNPQTPILSLGGKWIAYCPPSPSSPMSLKAHIPVPILGKAPGVSSVTSPHLPTLATNVTTDIPDSVVNKIMRETTQELISGAKWVGQQGMQAWNAYWNRPTSPPEQQARSSPQGWFAGRSPPTDPTFFPPTHGSTNHSATKEPGLISILDIDGLPQSNSLHPLATFQAPSGCSFLSFSPTATALFAASSKGDVQSVWDLLQIQYTKSSPLQPNVPTLTTTGPQVRQIAQFSRMTVTRIVDVEWTGPLGERLAMVTERGTVHLLDLPFSAFMWPPPRRRKVRQDSAIDGSDRQGASAVALASGALGAAYHAAKPFVSRSRRGSGAQGTLANGGTLKDSAAQSGRAIASTISSSLGKTGTAINQLRQNSENRLSLPPSGYPPVSGCVVWRRHRKHPTLYLAAGGIVRTFPGKPIQSTTVASWVGRGSRYKDVKIPLLSNDTVSPAVRQLLEVGSVDEYLDLDEEDVEGTNTMTLRDYRFSAAQYLDAASTIPQAEIESSAPYQPFRTDRRVVLCTYRTGEATDRIGELRMSDLDASRATRKDRNVQHKPIERAARHEQDSSVWAFGQPIDTIQLTTPVPQSDALDDALADSKALPPSAMERVLQFGDDGEQIVVTTRKRRTRHSEGDEDGFFEDDCEVLDFADQRV